MSLIERATLSVYIGRNKKRKIVVKRPDGTPIPFIDDGTDKLGVVIDGTEYFSTDGYISFDNNGGVTFKLGKIPNPPNRTKTARLIVYNDATPQGEPILAEDTPYRIAFDFK